MLYEHGGAPRSDIDREDRLDRVVETPASEWQSGRGEGQVLRE